MSEPHSTPSLAEKIIIWFSKRLTELLRSMADAVAATASLVWTVSPWLVFAIVALALASLVSPAARGWLITKSTDIAAFITGDDPGPPGFLYLEAPQVYTRERLVNDRFTQANWLREQLERTGQASFMQSFAIPSASSENAQSLTLKLTPGGIAASPTDQGGDEENTRNVAPSPRDVALDRLALFDKVNVYRDALRGELMDVQLDDGHDLDGNTLYRLNFNAIVAPFYDRRSYPGSAVFLVHLTRPNRPEGDAQRVEDEKELLRQWQREMQAFLTRVLEQRIEEFERKGALKNPTDPKEDLALDWFMRTKLIGTFLEYLNDFPHDLKDHLIEQCGENDPESEENQECRINYLAELAGFKYRFKEPSPDLTAVQAAQFRQSIEVAHLVNSKQWPKAGEGSYDNFCTKALSVGEGSGDQNKTQGAPPDTADGTGAAEQDASSAQTETLGGGKPSPSNLDPEQVAGTNTKPQKPPTIGQLAVERCLVTYEDEYRLRALSRMLAIIDDLRAGSLAAQHVVTMPSENEPRQIMADLLERFGDVVPESTESEGKDTGSEGKDIEIFEASSLAALEAKMKTLIEKDGKLDDLSSQCSKLLEAERVAKDNDAVKTSIDFARCRFLFAPFDNVRSLLAEFIVARVNGGLGLFYEETDPALSEYLTVTTDGCILTNCRVRVDLRAEDNGQVKEARLAQGLALDLDARTNGLTVYEISPRDGTIIRSTGSSLDLSAGLVALQGRSSAASSQRERAAHSEAVVLGFSAPAPFDEDTKGAETAVFGWTVRPQRRADGGWSSSHHRLSAVISAPSWWKRLDMQIHACWIDPEAARTHAKILFEKPEHICTAVYGPVTDVTQGSDGRTQTEKPIGHFHRPVRIQLPRSVEEVTARFNFDLVKTPYFDAAWRRDFENTDSTLMAGRSAHVTLAGERLWRGTVVTIDGKPADRITVLPDMKGVIAEFHCVQPATKRSDNTKGNRVKLTVWTAEGSTKPIDLDVRPFKPVPGTDEKPCYLLETAGSDAPVPEQETPSLEDK